MTTAATVDATRVSLHPEHLVDLRRSGLSDETIRALQVHSARPSDIAKLIGVNQPVVTSALVFPYPGEDGFCRAKVFPSFKDRDGHTVKYLQRLGSAPALYIPPLASGVLGDPTVPLAWTEGEKKAAKACQEGVACIGLGGLWCFLTDGKPLQQIDEIAHADRVETILPDSDVWTRPELLRPVYAIGKDLEGRGAKVEVAIIPPGPNGTKQGLDDYLVAYGLSGVNAAEALAALKHLSLKHTTFTGTAKWWKVWIQKRDAASDPPLDAVKLLEKVGHTRTLHPAQDFDGDIFHFGIPADDTVLLVRSDRTLIRGDQLLPSVALDDRGFDLSRFSKPGILGFLSGSTVKTDKLMDSLRRFFARFVIFRDERIPLLLAVWTAGTYLYRAFRVFPYLALRSPAKRCGKSRVLDLLALLAFNASPRVTNPTEAQLFRGPVRNGGTLLLDEIEHLKGDKDAFAGLLAVLNSGFERGGSVSRLEKRGDRFEEVSFPTYAPRALAGIARLADTLEDRSILLMMVRKLRSESTERFSPGRLEAEGQALRDECYIWALTHASDLAEVYGGDHFPSLEALDDRARDLWEPLMAIAMLAEEEAGGGSEFVKTLTGLAKALGGLREEGDTNTVKLIEALIAIREAGAGEIFAPTELLTLVQAHGFEWVKSTRALAGLLNPLGFISGWHKRNGKSARCYRVPSELLADLKTRYAGESPDLQPEADDEA